MIKLFAGSNYYPGGGYDDFRGNFDTVEQAVAKLKSFKEDDWAQIVKDDQVIRRYTRRQEWTRDFQKGDKVVFEGGTGIIDGYKLVDGLPRKGLRHADD